MVAATAPLNNAAPDFKPPFRKATGGKPQKPILAGSHGTSQHPDDKRHVLDEGIRSGDARLNRGSQDNLSNRQHNQGCQCQANQPIFKPLQPMGLRCFCCGRGIPLTGRRGLVAHRAGHLLGAVALRNSWSKRITSSNISAGTMAPRIFG